MTLVIILAIIIALVFIVYSSAMLIVWAYEMKAVVAYTKTLEHLKILENAELTGAMKHAKTLKIQYDHRRLMADIDRRRQFIIENLLLIGESSLKN